ncbi:MAG TPA: 4'-phosphopantetheinyl transferase superfamily protein [Caulobacteraceae bacterium]|nr:4'-phosphopantetheinyl transferase superfamily protein [Caulobacteraceae bacterium]
MLHAELEALVGGLFEGPVAVSVASADMYDGGAFAAEDAAVAKAAPKRRREFAAGRACARQALSRLGLAPQAIPVGPGGAPIWPDGVVGSISHCEGFCCAVATRSGDVSGVGVDAEAAEALTPRLRDFVCGPAEIAAFASLPDGPALDWGKLAFSAKEAFYKAYHPKLGAFLAFHDVQVAFVLEAPDRGAFSMTILHPGKPRLPHGESCVGRWRVDGARVYTGAMLRRTQLTD